jgi:hypothetical protein
MIRAPETISWTALRLRWSATSDTRIPGLTSEGAPVSVRPGERLRPRAGRTTGCDIVRARTDVAWSPRVTDDVRMLIDHLRVSNTAVRRRP